MGVIVLHKLAGFESGYTFSYQHQVSERQHDGSGVHQKRAGLAPLQFLGVGVVAFVSHM